jgi:AcrR family transcriptional regulator
MPARASRISPTAGSARRSVETARRRTQAERSEETRTRILKAAANLIRKRGYARFRTAEVAKEAGLSRGAQLHHFPTKDSLVVATLEHVFEQAQMLSRRRASAVNRPRDLIEAVIEDAREFFFSEHFMVAIDIVLSTSTDQSVRKQILDISRKARRPGRGRVGGGTRRQRCSRPISIRPGRVDAQSGSRHGAANPLG